MFLVNTLDLISQTFVWDFFGEAKKIPDNIPLKPAANQYFPYFVTISSFFDYFICNRYLELRINNK